MAATWLASGILIAQNLSGTLPDTRADARPSPEHLSAASWPAKRLARFVC
jgi:hypothetical protein